MTCRRYDMIYRYDMYVLYTWMYVYIDINVIWIDMNTILYDGLAGVYGL